MKRLLVFGLFCLPAIGCSGEKELPPTTDPDAIRREQERLGGAMPGGKASKGDAIKREQDRLKSRP